MKSVNVAFERASHYLAAMPPAISGQRGHDQTFRAACALVHGFALDPSTALSLLLSDFNPRCQPPWTECELLHKVQDAAKVIHRKPRGYLLAHSSPVSATPVRQDWSGNTPVSTRDSGCTENTPVLDRQATTAL